MFVLLIAALLAALAGVALLVRMFRADEPFYGVVGLSVLNVSGVLSGFYGMLASS
jgi:hypothetical protein